MKSARVYIAPFQATLDESSRSPCGSTISAFKKAVSAQDWPYDSGDDPSFYAARKFGGRLSWGVCRQDVRNNLRRGDVVVFFSFRKFKETGDSEYRLCAVATVEEKVSQTEIWQHQRLEIYRKYFNLLIRPSRSKHGSWKHFEPALEGSRLHHDWLWRITKHQGFRKADLERLQATDRFETEAAVQGRPLVIARNYVLFSSAPTETYILSKPPVIAWHSKGKAAEEWNDDKFSRTVKRLTLERAEEANGKWRSLRIRSSQRAHRHIVFELSHQDTHKWRAEFLASLAAR